MATIGEAEILNELSYHYKIDPVTGTYGMDQTAPPMPAGWVVLRPNNGTIGLVPSGEFSVTFINTAAARPELYLAARGTQNFVPDVLPADLGILFNSAPGPRIDYEVSVIEGLQKDFLGASIAGGGHSLTGLVMAGVSSQLGIPVLVENAPKTSDTITGAFGDKNVFEIQTHNDLVGNWGEITLSQPRPNRRHVSERAGHQRPAAS